ncbi:MAG: heme exporter protein CcmD [Gammaproteobacteria bacterium]|nr:heme exporter protein CcmD [Gammaproteobacteria bacterium]
MTLSEFFHMGGYGFYVWTSYGLALFVLIANACVAYWQHRRLLGSARRKARRRIL